ncbi:uncharacterized protein A4U43_C01F7580 [Asparagus officinalis]|uniref:Very-long-chain aldehyde decarbonylase CER1-like C-terminal domain-containing protein n=2 Tax=Asparagus officinalis TaxID=4686 RepID=A0A5P1FMM9_ASPOF|nr:uncharacterized protein A4U43_C01F7580 [Asparagus officinalis]
MWIMWPMTWVSMVMTWIYGSTFTVERNRMKKLNMETWAVPRYSFQYRKFSHREKINEMIEKAILEADEKGAEVISLGLLNQGDGLNGNGGIYYKNNPKIKIKIVDGTSLAAAVVLNKIPQKPENVLITGNLSKMAYVLTLSLCQKGIKVIVPRRDMYEVLKAKLPREVVDHVIFSETYESRLWLVGDSVKDREQMRAVKDVHFIPFSQFPLRIMRRDCVYHSTPSLKTPQQYENLHTCENWLPRKAMSAWRVAGIVHALEGWDAHECGDIVMDINKVWRAALGHGFLPFDQEKCK